MGTRSSHVLMPRLPPGSTSSLIGMITWQKSTPIRRRVSLMKWPEGMAAMQMCCSKFTMSPSISRGPPSSGMPSKSYQSSVRTRTTSSSWALPSGQVSQTSRPAIPSEERIWHTVHFYAATHGESLRSRVLNAKVWGQAVFATKWGTCEASGDGYIDVGSTHTWLGFLASHHISDANWAIADKNEACAALQPGASANGGWPRSMLTESGKYIKDGLTGNWWQVGCCKFGNDCADCGEDGTGWCHQSPGNCAVCGGWMDGGAPLHNCR